MNTTRMKSSGRAMARRVRPSGIRVRKAVLTTCLALAGLGVSTHYGGLLGEPGPHHPLADRAVAGGSAVVFLVFALVAVRGATEDLVSLVPDRFGDTRVTTLRMLCLLTGYAMVVLGSLSLLHVPWSKLILGGALTGVIVGIAAQPVLGNIFAGLVLLTARPFHIGEDVTIRAGALGGAIQGRVTDMTLLFVQLRTPDGTVLLPNSAVLSAAIAPADRPGAAGPLGASPPVPAPAREPGTGQGERVPPGAATREAPGSAEAWDSHRQELSMSDRYVWRIVVTDAQGRRDSSSDDALPNPYVSDEPAQHVAERVLALVLPGYAAREPAAKAVEVQVWLGRLQGDPIAVAEWHHDS